MDLEQDWATIKRVFEGAIASSKHCAIGSVDANGHPHVTPIGFVFLRNHTSAYYFEQYAKRLPENLANNRNVCLMAVNSGSAFWFRSLLVGRFSGLPGIRLYGRAGDPRAATPDELAALKRRIGGAMHMNGAKQLWSGLDRVRDVALSGVEPVTYPRMMQHLLG